MEVIEKLVPGMILFTVSWIFLFDDYSKFFLDIKKRFKNWVNLVMYLKCIYQPNLIDL